MDSNRALKVLIVDDEDSIRESLELALESQGYQVMHAVDGRQALRMLDQSPDLILLDWMLPDLAGPEVCREVRKSSAVPILMLTARGELDDRVDGLDAGADDYLPKPFKLKELLARMRALARRLQPQGQSELLQFGDLFLDPSASSVRRGGQEIFLTALEFQLLAFFVRHPRQVMSKEQLLNRVWGWDECVNENVVEVHVSSLRSKLGDSNRQLIRTVRGLGYVLGR